MDQLSNFNRKAKKEHQCDFCCGIINKGEVYNHQVNVWDGNIGSWRSHMKCNELTTILNMFDCGDGINQDAFDEAVREQFNEVDSDKLGNIPNLFEMAVIIYDKLKEKDG